jgi:hypothetical protein
MFVMPLLNSHKDWKLYQGSFENVANFLERRYIHSIALDRALASLASFMIVRYIRCGVISPTINLVLATWYDHQGHLLAKPADTTSWRSRWNAGEKHGRWILPTSTYRACRVLLHAVNLRHGTDGFTSSPKEGVLRDGNRSKLHSRGN